MTAVISGLSLTIRSGRLSKSISSGHPLSVAAIVASESSFHIDLDMVQRGSVSGKEESDNYIHYLDTVQRARDDMSYDIER